MSDIPSVESCESALKNFWGKLSIEDKQQLGSNVAFAISYEGTSTYTIEIMQEQIEAILRKNPQQSSLAPALKIYNSLSPEDQSKIQTKLSEYFLKRNTKNH